MRQFDISLTDRSKAGLILRLSGIGDRSAAEALKGMELYAPRDALPALDDGEFYHADLVDLTVELGDGTPMGRVRGLADYGAGSLLEIVRPDGKPLVVPFSRAAVPVIDLAAGRVVIDPPPGLLESDGAGLDDEEPGAGS